ncbi:MAG: 6-phosphofructokinase, partial [Nitrospirae bacterium]|nr:6-phosphofructokinase [Nitrospirota bacterium]
PLGGEITIMEKGELGGEARLGGIGKKVSDAIGTITGKETRYMVLGHLQRGGAPTTFDRLLALRFGAAAVRFAEARKFGSMAAIRSTEIVAVPIEEAIGVTKAVSPNSDIIKTARSLGISFGD